MIPGFNTDVEHDNVVYHIQTEDKGPKNPLVLSLVYNRGTILASKRVSYNDLFGEEYNEKVLAEKMQRQHQLICAAVRAGRINDLKQMSGGGSAKAADAVQITAANTAASAAPKANGTSISVETSQPPQAPVPLSPEIPLVKFAAIQEVSQPLAAAEILPEIMIPAVEIQTETPQGSEAFFDVPIFEDVKIIEEPEILPAAAVSIVSELSGTDRPKNQKLTVEMLGDSRFKGGERKTVGIMICRGTERRVVPGAEIMLKVIGSSFRPLIFHAKSDTNGLARVHLQLPHFDAGRAALLIRAIDSGEEAELRRVVSPG